MSNIKKEHEFAYIYFLLEPETEEIRYVGWTVSPEKRLKRHLSSGELLVNTHRSNWIRKLLEEGKSPIMKIVEKIKFSDWREREKYWILFCKESGCKLVNLTDGGDGGGHPISDKHKEILRLVKTGRIVSFETIQRLIKSHLGKKASDETKRKMSESHKGKNTWSKGSRSSNETREKQSLSQRGKSKKQREIKYIGVYNSHGGKYRAALQNKHLGTFSSQEDAAKAYDKYFRELYCTNDGINFPNEKTAL